MSPDAKKPSKLSPTMRDLLRYLYGDRVTAHCESATLWNAATFEALESRGLVTRAAGSWVLTADGLAYCQAQGWVITEGYTPAVEPSLLASLRAFNSKVKAARILMRQLNEPALEAIFVAVMEHFYAAIERVERLDVNDAEPEADALAA